MTPPPKEMLLTVARFVLRMKALDEDGLRLVKEIVHHIENPAVAIEEPTDAIERWAFGRRDPAAFCPTQLLWEDYVAWCVQVGERPGTWPAFCAKLKKKKWRKGKTHGRKGYWGLRT